MNSNYKISDKVFEKISEAKINKNTILTLSNLGLSEVPKEIFELDYLERLDLSENQITKIPKEISKLQSLKFLDLNQNKIASLPLDFRELKNLKELTLVENKFKKLPKAIYSLVNLNSLNIASCKVTELSAEINQLINLKILWLYNNPISKIEIDSKILNQLVSLSILKTQVSDYSFIKYLYKIARFHIGNNSLTYLPNEFENLETLETLYIGYSLINKINESIKYFKQLSSLTLSNLPIKDINESVFELNKLTNLEIYKTEIKSLPRGIGKLTNLTKLNISRNFLESIPETISELTKLEYLNLSYNNIIALPKELGKLASLKSLILSGNKLISLPTEVANITNLQTLTLANNLALISPPKQVVREGTESILSYLKDLLEVENVWSSRMVLVGEGGIGKSCLLDSLLDRPYNNANKTTHGINVEQIKFPSRDNQHEMELNVWDFGGQDIYHATHQFYLTNHSLFILVWSARLGYESCKIYKWLETISALAPDSPIFIVATNSDARGADLPKGDLEKQFGNKLTFFEVDNESRQGIATLRCAISEKASQLKYMGVERPRSWIKSIQQIKALTETYISKSKLVEIFISNGVSKESHESLAQYMHDLGEVLYYPDEEQLKNTIIIKPAWVSKQIAKVLDNEDVSNNEGFLSKEEIDNIWEDIEESLRIKLIALMERFDLSYKTKGDREMNLIVEKLKYEEHEDYSKVWSSFNDTNEISFKYALETIPAGIPTWFIARMHRFSIKIHWRYGVLLQDITKQNIGLVLTSPERKEIWLKVRGRSPFYFFAQLRDSLELTLNRFEGLKKTTYVPCPGHSNTPCKYLFELKQLEKRLSLDPPRFQIECPEAIEEVSVMKMLFGLSFAPNNDILVQQLTSEVEKIIKTSNQEQTIELIKLLQLEFLKSYVRYQEITDLTCPNIFTLKEKDISLLEQDLIFQQFELQLFCQMPGCFHAVGDPYEIKVLKKWIKAISPYYNSMIKILKYVLPIVPAASQGFTESLDIDTINSITDITKEYAEILPEFKDTNPDLVSVTDRMEVPIRIIRKILDLADTTQSWRGMKRTISPEGHILWLCDEHFKEYKV